MSLLLEDLAEDLAEETWVSNLRGTDRFDEEVRELERLRAAESAIDDFLRRIDEAAHQATTYVVARVPQVEGLWQAALSALRENRRTRGCGCFGSWCVRFSRPRDWPNRLARFGLLP